MARKQKIQLQQPQDLEAIDAELATAMDTLDKKNEEVTGLLAQYAPPPAPPETVPTNQLDGPGAPAPEPLPGDDNPESP
ncbi:MAG: hypothetical protein NTZ09_01205 [Candidatus Hydrogenedentes bacterium]|nr:hypothetical protein [Candidatus Hydrogenedentota bacterium]